MGIKRGKYKKRKPKPPKEPFIKWVQKEGRTIDDITFSNGEIEVDFDTWINEYY